MDALNKNDFKANQYMYPTSKIIKPDKNKQIDHQLTRIIVHKRPMLFHLEKSGLFLWVVPCSDGIKWCWKNYNCPLKVHKMLFVLESNMSAFILEHRS